VSKEDWQMTEKPPHNSKWTVVVLVVLALGVRVLSGQEAKRPKAPDGASGARHSRAQHRGEPSRVELPWSTSLDCPDWKQGDGPPPIAGLFKGGDWKCDGTHGDQITVDANYAFGGGGKGFRHWQGDGTNNNGGGIAVVLHQREPELWIRWYMRYEKGFKWKGGEPYYDKLFYIRPPRGSGGRDLIPEWGYGSLCFAYAKPQVRAEPGLWKKMMGGAVSDGKWHCHEIHMKMDTNGKDGIAEWWADGEKVIDRKDVDFGTHAGWVWMSIGSNQTTPENGRPMALDFDDIAIRTSGRIGPIRAQGNQEANQ